MSSRFTSEGLILRVTRFRESDRFVRVLVPSGEVLELLARSVGKSVKRFGGGLEPLSLQLFDISQRRTTHVAEQAQHVNDYLALRGSLSRFYLASYGAERALQVAPCEGLFELMRALLDLLASTPDDSLDLLAAKCAFDMRLLAMAGFAPQLSDCAICGSPLPSQPLPLEPSGGGFMCGSHSEERSTLFQPGVRVLLRKLAECELGSLPGRRLPAEHRQPVARAVSHFLDEHLRGPLKSVKLLAAYL